MIQKLHAMQGLNGSGANMFATQLQTWKLKVLQCFMLFYVLFICRLANFALAYCMANVASRLAMLD